GPVPSPRAFHSAVFDAVGDRMLVFGGAGSVQNDLWKLSLDDSTWSPLPPIGIVPAARLFQSGIYDAKYRRIVIFGGKSVLDDPTWAVGPGDTIRWSPSRPVIAVSTTDVDLPILTVGDTYPVPFTISNQGLLPVEVDSLRLPTSEMRLSATAPIHLAWNARVTEILTVAAAVPRSAQDTLVIFSNDPK